MYFLQAVLPDEFFTPQSLATLAGCTGIVFVVCSGIQRAFNYNPKWLALVIAIVVSLIGAYLAKDPENAKAGVKYIIAFLNGFLIYASATGTNQVLGNDQGAPAPPAGGVPAGRQPRPLQQDRRFLTRWF